MATAGDGCLSFWRSPSASGLSSPRHGIAACSRQFPRRLRPSPTPPSKVVYDIQSTGVIACLRAPSAELALDSARAAFSGGISVLEVVMSTPGVFEVINQLVQEHPAKSIGVGTVLSTVEARFAIEAGVKFLMSPALLKDVLDDVRGSEILYIPGVMTPTEILFAHTAGARMVKVYPVSALGGVKYISALRKPFSHMPMVASQGITIDLVGDYIAEGASAVVLSDAIFDREAIRQRDFGAITQLAQLAASVGSQAVEQSRQR
ncbi:hypothetical protein Ancab_006137 [Ancistrocladus abbreviatus]